MTKPPNSLKLIREYFKMDILNMEGIPLSVKKHIQDTFNYAADKKKTIEEITKELEGSELAEMKVRYAQRLKSNSNPFPLRLHELKPILQEEAFEEERSLHSLIRKILKKHVDGKKMILV